jgi:hypothetical protein
MAESPQKPADSSPEKPNRGLRALVSTAIESFVEHHGFLKPPVKFLKEGAVELKKAGWGFVAVIVVLAWLAAHRYYGREITKIKNDAAVSNSFFSGKLSEMSNEINHLHGEIDHNKREAKEEADSREAKAQAGFSAKLQEKDAEINRLTTEKASLQTRNDFWTAQSAIILEACSNLVNSSSVTAANRQEIDSLVGQVQTAVKMVQDYKSLAETNSSLLANLGSSAPELQVVIDGLVLPMGKTVLDIEMPLTNSTQTVTIQVWNVGNRAAERVSVALTFPAAYTNAIEVPEAPGGWNSQPFEKQSGGRWVPDYNTKHYSVVSQMPISSGGAGFGCSPITFKNTIDKPHDYTISILAASGGAKLCLVVCTLHFRPDVHEPKLE